LDTFLGKRSIQIMNIVGDMFALVAMIFLILYSFKAIRGNASIRTAAMQVQVVYAFYLPFLLGCFSFVILIPMNVHQKIQSLRNKR
jgi:TRAP-type C4-dicarboxylate transport system permease small subunit